MTQPRTARRGCKKPRCEHSAESPSRWALYALAVTILLYSASVWAQGASVAKILPHPGMDIGAEINTAIASLPNKTGTVQLPPGSYVQSKTITVIGAGIHIVGSPGGTFLTYNPESYRMIDSADSTEGWHGSDVNVGLLTSIGDDHPDPVQGEGYIEVETGSGSGYQVEKSIPSTNFASAAKVGIWATLNMTHAPQHEIQFFVSDGRHTAYWTLLPNNIFGQWKFFGLDPSNPSGTDGGLPDMKAVTVIGFRNLRGGTKYYFDAVALYTPAGPSFAFTSCSQCSLENLTIQWEPAGDSDAVIEVNANTSDLLLNDVHTVGGTFGFDFNGDNSANICKACVAEYAVKSGFELRGTSTLDQLLSVQANHDNVGIHVLGGASHNSIASPRCVHTNNVGIFVEGSENQIENAQLETWMTFGLVVMHGSHNSITGVEARSSVGQSAIQFLAGAADNTLSSILIEQSGGNGLDFGGRNPIVRNTVAGLTVHHSGSSSWHGGPGGSAEGRGVCICGANENTFSHVRVYDAGQAGPIYSGVEGIIIGNGSSGNLLEDVLVSDSRFEGIIVWGDADNTLRNVRLMGNGLRTGRAGIRIEGGARNTVLDGVCYSMNGGGGIKNISRSSSIRNARQVRDMNPEMDCQ